MADLWEETGQKGCISVEYLYQLIDTKPPVILK